MTQRMILLVDDDAGLLWLNQLVLKSRMDLDVRVAQTGQAALEQIDRQQPDLVILDMMMPDMDGIEVCRWIRAQPAFAAIPIVMLTALDDKTAHVSALESGVNAIWLKPLAPSELIDRVRQILTLPEDE